MSTDDTGSWSRPNPTERTDPDFVDITRLAPASDEADQPADEALDEISDDDLVAVDVDDVDADDVDDDDIDAIMAGFERSKAADTSANEAPAEASDSADATADEAPAATETGEVEPAPVAEAEPEPADATEPEPAAEPEPEPEPAAEPEPEPAVKGFAALGLRQELVDTLNDLGYEEPTPIQRETIPLLLTGRDMLGQAATGTGKTAAFALPALNAIEPGFPDAPSVLVLTPTRELAVQVSEAIVKYGKKLGAKVVPVFGGQPIGRQLGALDRGAHVVVATPGRAIDHIGRGSLRLDKIKTVILDEADEMLDMGFTDDIESILESTPTD
ncbi:MAG: ATP-dependent RNA helicase DeaD, partial [Ilumatobacter sp.]